MLNHTIANLAVICQQLPIGTNLGMLQFLWMLISGALLPHRGAINPALKSIGLSDQEVRRSWAAFSSGAWSIFELCSKKELKDDEIAVIDAGVKIETVQNAKVPRFVLKQAQNVTARRNFLPKQGLGRKREYGEIVRPLARTHKGKTLPASTPDETCTITKDGREIRVEIWRDLVRENQKPSESNQTFDIYVFHDPKYKKPWVLATPLKLKAESVHQIYSDRWPVEQVPLSSKQMIGSHRQFVHSAESIQRLPEITLLAGFILSFQAASFPPVPTGFWDKNPKRTPGRFRRQLMGKPFPRVAELPQRLREKRSVSGHLLKGKLGPTQKVAQKAGD